MFKIALISLTFLATIANATQIREIRVATADCNECGMTIFGELSVKVCGQGAAPAMCCVAVNLDNQEDNFVEGETDIFSGVELRECYNFDLGKITDANDFGLTLYHALSDGGQFDSVTVLTDSNQELHCEFKRFIDGSDYEYGSNCRLS